MLDRPMVLPERMECSKTDGGDSGLSLRTDYKPLNHTPFLAVLYLNKSSYKEERVYLCRHGRDPLTAFVQGVGDTEEQGDCALNLKLCFLSELQKFFLNFFLQ